MFCQQLLLIGTYTPGMMTDVVREVKDAARVREDALLNRVKAMVEERQWSMNESNLRMMRDIEELKVILDFFLLNTKCNNRFKFSVTSSPFAY